LSQNKYSQHLKEAISVGMVSIDEDTMEATVLAPPNAEDLTDQDWLDILAAATEMHTELKSLGFTVHG
jgi:hypothetical protein